MGKQLKSKDMFKTVPLLRGFTEITVLYDIATKHDSIICGGYARYCASTAKKVKEAKDVDLFPKTPEVYDTLLKELLELGYEIKHENHVSTTLSPKPDFEEKLGHIPTPQIIKPVKEGKILTVGTTEEILDNFDFSVVRAAIISSKEVLVDEDFIKDEQNHVLRLKNIHCPISSLLRCCKYARKGYFLKPTEALKLFKDWDNRGDDYKNRMIELFEKSAFGEQTVENFKGISQKEIDELEALLRID